MKKILLLVVGISSISAFAQINVSANPKTVTNQNTFIDASQNGAFANNIGKGINFPRTNLTSWTFKTASLDGINYPTGYDGIVVYNSATGAVTASATTGQATTVTPGFYYFSNPGGTTSVANGVWKPFTPASVATGPTNGNFWTLTGNSGTTVATVDPTTFAVSGGNFIGTTDAKNVILASNNIARMEIGMKPANVGGADFSFVLDVFGKARFRDGLVTSASTYPDYVFDKYFTGTSTENAKYNFLSLAETEKFIKENNHLPGVTSIKELAKDGGAYMVDNTKLSIQSLEKVEELYLHTIQQQKEIDALKAELKEIKAALKH